MLIAPNLSTLEGQPDDAVQIGQYSRHLALQRLLTAGLIDSMSLLVLGMQAKEKRASECRCRRATTLGAAFISRSTASA